MLQKSVYYIIYKWLHKAYIISTHIYVVHHIILHFYLTYIISITNYDKLFVPI